MRFLTYIALTAALLNCQGVNDKMNDNRDVSKNMLATNACFPKGGLGIINTDLYIDLRSPKNELLFGPPKGVVPVGERWSGHDTVVPEVVLYFEGRVLSPQDIPRDFDLSKAVVISFEGDKVRFFDPADTSGGYYKRLGSD
jgi:hypothetical protein